jgi:hypothetical protein
MLRMVNVYIKPDQAACIGAHILYSRYSYIHVVRGGAVLSFLFQCIIHVITKMSKCFRKGATRKEKFLCITICFQYTYIR